MSHATRDVDILIVGGGITGLAALYDAHRALGCERVMLVEPEARLGGKIDTVVADGYVFEGGPDSFIAAEPTALEFCRELGIERRLIQPAAEHRRAYIKRGGKLHPLPAGVTGLVPGRRTDVLRTSLLGLRGRARVLLEPLIPERRSDADESIAEYAVRRFGLEGYRWMIEPILAGIHAGEGEALSLRANFPRLAERQTSDRRHGSGVRTGFVTPRDGVGEMVAAVRRAVPRECVRTGTEVVELRPAPRGYEVSLSDRSRLRCARIVLAVPSFVAADLVAGFDDALARRLAEIAFVSTVTVAVTLPARSVEHFTGSGYLSPRMEGGDLVGCTWMSNKFPNRVPPGRAMLRFFVGRAGRADAVGMSDRELLNLVQVESRDVLGLREFDGPTHIRRWPRGMPQYTVGHLDRVTAIENALAAYPGLAVAGASYRGVGIPSCVQSGRAAVAQLLRHVDRQ